MRNFRILTLLAAVCAVASAAEFTGRWAGAVLRDDGGKREYEFVIKTDGGKVTGSVASPQGEFPILQGSVNGDEISFRAGANGRTQNYKGKMTGNDLQMTVPGRGNPQMIAKLVSKEPTPSPRPDIKLPSLKKLKDNGLARTPPMGWNSWNKFATRIDDKLIREIADAMVSSGMQKAGYRYINIDDGWEGERDANGNIQTNSRFPDMKKLADYVHSKGLKLGIYSSPGPRTCAGFIGSFQHEAQDAKTFAAWGIDYLKYDWCTAARWFKDDDMQPVYQIMGEALQATKRPIVYSLCQYGRDHVEKWGADVGGNLWRTTGDIRDAWESMVDLGFEKQKGLEAFARPGHWNDPDMLEIGNGHMTTAEYRTHMSLWAILAAPLIAGNDLRDMTPEIRDILINPDVIAVNQDPLGKQGKQVSKSGDVEVWARPLKAGGIAVGLFNRGAQAASVTAKWPDVGASGAMKVRDLWKHEDLGSKSGEFSAEVPSHGVVMVRLSK